MTPTAMIYIFGGFGVLLRRSHTLEAHLYVSFCFAHITRMRCKRREAFWRKRLIWNIQIRGHACVIWSHRGWSWLHSQKTTREESNLSRLARYSQYIRVCSLKHNVPVCTYNSASLDIISECTGTSVQPKRWRLSLPWYGLPNQTATDWWNFNGLKCAIKWRRHRIN